MFSLVAIGMAMGALAVINGAGCWDASLQPKVRIDARGGDQCRGNFMRLHLGDIREVESHS